MMDRQGSSWERRESCRIPGRKYRLKVEMMESKIEQLMETLADLVPSELQIFYKLLMKTTSCDWIPVKKLEQQSLVFSLVQTHAGQCVEVAKKILKSMRKIDLLEQMEDSCPRAKKKRFDELLSAEIHRVSAVAVTKDLVLETLNDLKGSEFMKFKWFLQLTQFQRRLPQIPWSEMQFANRTDLVMMMWTKCGDECLQVTEEVLTDMKRSDLVEKLPVQSSCFKVKASVSEAWPELKQEVRYMESVIKRLLEQLDGLTVRDLKDIQKILSWARCNSPYLCVSSRLLGMEADLQDTVFLMVQTYSHHPVDKMVKLFQSMNREDLVFNLIQSTEKKLYERKRSSSVIQKVALMAAVKHLLLETFNSLSQAEFFQLKRLLYPNSSQTTKLSLTEMVNVMVEELGAKAVEETRKIFKHMNRADLLEVLPETCCGTEIPSTCLNAVKSESPELDSSSWTKVDPEVDRTSPDEAQTFSLQSEAGRFECSVSGLRWFCQEKVAFRYRFCSWDGHMERMESRGYRPAGPLMDITVSTGTMLEVQLPHWVYIEDVPELLDNFAVLHVTDYGDVLEKVAQVTETHVTLTEPAFSLLGCLLNIFFSPRINCCNTLIYYQPNKPFLKLHVYLILPDPALKQSIYKDETSGGYEAIKKPHPDQRLKMDCGFTLKASVETAHIQPPQITLRHVSQDPNFYEVFIENPDRRFNLELLQTGSETVWFCEIRKGQFVP
ncbi:PREDICTED: uncharacterized protein LOC107094396 isoform X1 [Cyprinodon variegatus]|uniref:uncharacterized protein LOC107094396 isoform X1 n=1 Tax=Cyprinodon variegatus TaxID=28743 RepID=UPI000742BB7E|nr:PREDICTED: uncharacterized protein LOC107094396 isoform X1 [Cyprinodon variegatus]